MTVICRLAIVNRGEPAIRALNAIADLNHEAGEHRLTSVVLYTEPDARALFVRRADEAICLGPATFVDPADGTRKSAYLDEARVVDALIAAEVDAVWVGWGFVAEHASFAQLCEKAGIVFVGPESATIRRLGDKITAKQLAEQVGVPVLPWSDGPLADVAAAEAAGDRLGYPLVLKATGGGGGHGIRVVATAADLPAAYRAARDDAARSFGDSAVFAEQFVARARHVEVQVISDGRGGTWAVGLRDCSVQRRHQKLLEESGSTVLDAAGERRILDAAVQLVDAIGYRSAGTVEFLVDPSGGDFWFLEVNTRLQVEHPVTEETAGIDLVKLQLQIACGGRLEGGPPAPRGYAIEARLCAEDPADDFAPAPGRIAVWRPPAGPGIRVDSGIGEGDDLAPQFDPLVAKIVAWGPDRAEAIARLTRALETTTLVIEGGTTNRGLLLYLLQHPDLRSGTVDTRWLDRLAAERAHLAPPDPVAVLAAAVEAYEADEIGARAAFHAGARRGRPEVPDAVGHALRLRYRGVRYRVQAYRTGADTYSLTVGDVPVPVTVRELGDFERRLVLDGRAHQIVISAQRTSFLIEVDGAAHRVHRDDGGIVRAHGPAFVLDVLVAPGDEVPAGAPLVLVESMKMESIITAPFAGRVAEVLTSSKVQIEAGAPLLRIQEPVDERAQPPEHALAFPVVAEGPAARTPLGRLHRYLLGFDLAPHVLTATMAEYVPVAGTRGRDVPEEAELLELFADTCTLQQSASETDGRETSSLEYVRTFLQWLDADRVGLPERVRADLRRMLARYGVRSLDRTPELEAALVWMWRSFRRTAELAPAITTLLQRRLRDRGRVPVEASPALRALLARLAAATQIRYPVIADLSRDLLFHYFDEPLVERTVTAIQDRMSEHLEALRSDPDRTDREERVTQLVQSPQPARAALLHEWPEASPAFRALLLEIRLRRFYGIRPLHDLRFVEHDGTLLGAVDYEFEGKALHVVGLYTPLSDLPAAARAVAAHVAGIDPDRRIVLDVVSWRDEEGNDSVPAQVEQALAAADFGRPLHRIDLDVTSGGRGPEHVRTVHVSYQPTPDGYAEELLYRNLHPMLARRMDLWRLSNFELTRLRSVEDVYLFRAVARDNPKDVRLFALAEVRDLTPVRDETGKIVSLPLLERMGLQCLASMREAMAGIPEKKRPQGNRVVLYVRPPFDVETPGWRRMVARFQALATTANLHKIVLRVQLPEADGLVDRILDITGRGEHDLRLRVRPPEDRPIRSLTPYLQKVLRAASMKAPYPYEIVRMLTPEAGVVSDFPRGQFVEYDLDDSGRFLPVDRPYGENTANLVVGLLTNYPAAVPEGMARVAIFGDPTHRLGALAEPECRRVMAALDLAERRQIPVEWFAISSGARIAMDSGTENMDWISAVLRRLIEFTQGGGEVNVVVTGINVGAQPYWNAEATMLMHTRGILVMTPESAMVLTGKTSLDFSGGVSAEDNFGIGGYERVMGPNGQGQYWAPTLQDAAQLLMRHYEFSYLVPGERCPRRRPTSDPVDRDVRTAPHDPLPGSEFTSVGDVFSAERNPERKKPFRMRAIMRAVSDEDTEPLERWARWRGAESAIVWDTRVGGIPVCMLGLEARALARRGYVPADGPGEWTSGTLFPQTSRKVGRAINAASGNRPLVVLANLSGFDGSPESMRRWQLEYGAEIGRAVTNFRGPIVFVVVSRYHGGAFVVFSKRLNESIEMAAVEGSYASVIGGAPAAGVVLTREVDTRTDADPRLVELRAQLDERDDPTLRATLHDLRRVVRAEKLGEVAEEYDGVHSIQRAQRMGSVDHIIPADRLRPYVIDAVERGLARDR